METDKRLKREDMKREDVKREGKERTLKRRDDAEVERGSGTRSPFAGNNQNRQPISDGRES